jgi:hypothetical protein
MPKHLHKIAPAAAEHEEIPGVRIALQRLLHLKGEPFMPRRMSVWPVAIYTRTPEGMGIIAAASPLSRRCQIGIGGAGKAAWRHLQTQVQ